MSVSASVLARFLARARETRQDFSLVLTRYAIERLLYRIGVSSHADHFLLKGALLFDLWFDVPHRPTRDIDLLGFGSGELSFMESTFKEDQCHPRGRRRDPAAPLEESDHRYFVAGALAMLDQHPAGGLVVQSLGGMVGLRLAPQHPKRVAAFVSCDSPLGVQQPDILAALEARARRAASQTLEQRSLGAWFLRRSPERAAFYAQINHFNPGSLSP